jgi:hypothetical protein
LREALPTDGVADIRSVGWGSSDGLSHVEPSFSGRNVWLVTGHSIPAAWRTTRMYVAILFGFSQFRPAPFLLAAGKTGASAPFLMSSCSAASAAVCDLPTR